MDTPLPCLSVAAVSGEGDGGEGCGGGSCGGDARGGGGESWWGGVKQLGGKELE